MITTCKIKSILNFNFLIILFFVFVLIKSSSVWAVKDLIKDCGCQPNDTSQATINSTKFNNCISSYPKESIFIPEGEYSFSSSVFIHSGTTIQGAATHYTLLHSRKGKSLFVKRKDTYGSHNHISNLFLICDATDSTVQPALDMEGMQAGTMGASNSFFSNLRVQGFSWAFRGYQFWTTTLDNCYFENQKKGCIFIGGESNNITIRNVFMTLSPIAIMAEWSYGSYSEIHSLHIDECNIEQISSTVFSFRGVINFSITNSHFENNAKYFALSNISDAATISGNYFQHTGDIDLGNINWYATDGRSFIPAYDNRVFRGNFSFDNNKINMSSGSRKGLLELVNDPRNPQNKNELKPQNVSVEGNVIINNNDNGSIYLFKNTLKESRPISRYHRIFAYSPEYSINSAEDRVISVDIHDDFRPNEPVKLDSVLALCTKGGKFTNHDILTIKTSDGIEWFSHEFAAGTMVQKDEIIYFDPLCASTARMDCDKLIMRSPNSIQIKLCNTTNQNVNGVNYGPDLKIVLKVCTEAIY